MIPGSKQNHPTLLKSFAFAWQGFRIALREERNIKIMFFGAAFAIVAGIVVLQHQHLVAHCVPLSAHCFCVARRGAALSPSA